MFLARRPLVASALVVVVAAFVLLTGTPAAGQEASKLEGTWIARVVEIEGKPSPWPFQWSDVVTPDNSGRAASIFGNVDISFPDAALGGPYGHTPVPGRVVVTGPGTSSFEGYFYLRVAEGLSQPADGRVQVVLEVDKDVVAPQAAPELLARHHVAGMLEQFQERLEGPLAQVDGIPRLNNRPAAGSTSKQSKRTQEDMARRSGYGDRARATPPLRRCQR